MPHEPGHEEIPRGMRREAGRTDGLHVAILATDGVEQVELVEPRKALDESGAQTEVIAPKAGEIQGFRHHDKADRIRVDRELSQADPADYDAVLLPGGALNADALRIIPEAQSFVRAMDEAGKPIAAICHAPWLLVSAGLVEGRTLTSYKTLQDDIRNAGGEWVDQEVCVDANWVTSRKPDDIPAFNREMLRLFSNLPVSERSSEVAGAPSASTTSPA